MYKALYRTYRPEVFSEMLGQEHIVRILQNQLAGGTVSHAYLFCGTRGTGKTTTARILAKGVNCLSEEERPCGHCENCRAIQEGRFMDLVEIDAASNNGVENIRELRDNVNYAPVMGKKKVYIIDEVHMLSTGAFNALLKTLEEPPDDVMFILCTTEPEKLPATILSRCMRMDFRRVPERRLYPAFQHICEEQGVEMEESGLRLIVSHADGSVRDGLTLLEQCIAGRSGKVSGEEVLDALGAVDEETYWQLTEYVLRGAAADGLCLIGALIERGKDARQILQGWMAYYRNLLMIKFIRKPEKLLNISVEQIERVRRQSEEITLQDLSTAIVEIAKTLSETRTTTQPRILLEVCFVQLAARAISKQKRNRNSEKMVSDASLPVSQDRSPVRSSEPAGTGDQRQETAVTSGSAGQAGQDMKEIWERVLEQGEQEQPAFRIVRSGAVPVKMNEREFVISAGGMARNYLKQNREFVAQLIAVCSGQPRMVLFSDDPAPSRVKEHADAEQIAQQASEVLDGIPVEIVES